jgi:hypothetical protein
MSDLTHYVYFDKKTGHILSVGNESDTRYETGIRTTFLEVEGFLSGKWKFKDYLIGYKRNADGTSNLAIIQATDQGYAFKHNIFEWISETDENVECVVTWDGQNKQWKFKLDDRIKDYYDVVVAPKLVFFVTLEDDFDFLIRTIFVSLSDLITSNEIVVPFDSNIEHKIDKISISSKLVLKSYGLKIIHE